MCMDRSILTHAVGQVDLPEQDQVSRFLPPYEPRQILDPDNPVSIGTTVGPEASAEVRYLAHHKRMEALGLIPQVQQGFEGIFGRDSGGLVHPYHCRDVDVIVTALGSMIGIIKDMVDECQGKSGKIGALGICSFEPSPLAAVREVL